MDTKTIFGESLLALNKTKDLDKITISDILKKAGFSRQTFYNHFADKYELIQYVYKQMIIPTFDHLSADFDFTANMLVAYQNMQNHRKFMQQACRFKDQNNLQEYIFYHCYNFDLAWYQLLFKGPLPTEVLLACQYHAHACTHLTLEWIEDSTFDYQEIVEASSTPAKPASTPSLKNMTNQRRIKKGRDKGRTATSS
ncbi:TetR/AcrR family transcriptional regulator [Enterococcus cecorum]|nr:TetR/AcrR family transcriptional regulator [Enterococcus cecorum]